MWDKGSKAKWSIWRVRRTSPFPDRRRRTALLPKCVFVCWVVSGRECPEGRGTWNIKPCHGSSAQLRALSCSGSLSKGRGGSGGGTGLEKVPLLTPSQSCGTHHCTPCARWKCLCHFTFGITDITEGKVGLWVFCLILFIDVSKN